MTAEPSSVPLARELVAALIAGSEGLHQLLARFVDRAIQAHESVTLLAERAPGDAMSVFRTLLELTIDAAYILDVPDQRERRRTKFEAFEDVTDSTFLKEFGDAYWDDAAPVAAVQSRATAAKVALAISNNNSWDDTTKNRAEALSKLMGVPAYAPYRDACRAAHSGPVTLRYVFATEDAPAPSSAAHAVALAHLYLSALVKVIRDALELPLSGEQPPFPWNDATTAAEATRPDSGADATRPG